MSTEKTEPPQRSKTMRSKKISLPAMIVLGLAIYLLWNFGIGQAQSDTAKSAIPYSRADIWQSLLLVGALIIFKAFFSISESALIAVRQSRIKQLVEEKRKGAKNVERLLKNPTHFLASIQIGIEIVGAFASVEAALKLAGPFERAFGKFFTAMHLDPTGTSIVFITICVIFVMITFGEVIPKSISIIFPETIALGVARPMELLVKILSPFVYIITAITNLVVYRWGGHARFASPIITEEELKVIVETSEEHGVLEEEETEIIKSVFEFTDTIAREVMNPRTDIVAVDVNTPIEEVVKIIAKTGYSRLPVFEERIDKVLGIVHAKEILSRLGGGKNGFTLKDIIRPAYFIPENKNVVALLREMRQNKVQIVIVRDEYGGTAGLLTIEDLIEELVGEIQDEYDTEEPLIQKIDSQNYLVDGRMHLDDLNEHLGTNLESEEFDTVGGLLFGLFGRQPEIGEHMECDNVHLTIHKTDGRRIEIVSIRLETNNEKESEELEEV